MTLPDSIPNEEFIEIVARCNNESDCIANATGYSVGYAKKKVSKLRKRGYNIPYRRLKSDIVETEHKADSPKPKGEYKMSDKMEKPTGIQYLHDNLIKLDHDKKTIRVKLGKWGEFNTDFTTHERIQEMYVRKGDNLTAERVATEVNLPHAEAMKMYARLFGFTKASLPVSDLAILHGMESDDVTTKMLQAQKRKFYRHLQMQEEKQMQRDALLWRAFKYKLQIDFNGAIERVLKRLKFPRNTKKKLDKEPRAWILGTNDFHWRKFCWNYLGKPIWDRRKAHKSINDGIDNKISQGLLYGTPEKIYVGFGGDNLTTDNPHETTTAGTSQVGEVEGVYELDLDRYIEFTLLLHHKIMQVAHMVLVPTFGNHDNNTSRVMYSFLKQLYKDNPRVTVIENFHTRTYLQYGSNALCFAHGQDMGVAKWKREAHKLFLVEAREQGINLKTATNLMMYLQHVHHDMREDLGGVRFFTLPAPPPPDKWHRQHAFIGNKVGIALHIVDKKAGEDAMFF